ncbi:hypothetical protein CHARACLAT_012929 [Characodon lateralis]|uniref:Uncharacterized protein n=1 Tax=Characodon lateralis TaxID=208331 RepID=A0ABU7E999_9TELE|nr:hypothetical protein [Characodon lateralis]
MSLVSTDQRILLDQIEIPASRLTTELVTLGYRTRPVNRSRVYATVTLLDQLLAGSYLARLSMRPITDKPCPPSTMPHLALSRNIGLSPATVKDLPSESP